MTKLLARLLRSPQCAQTRFDAKLRCFVRDLGGKATKPRRCRGLTPAIRKAFPVPVLPACSRCKATRASSGKRRTPGCLGASDIKHGLLVDRQLSLCAQLGFEQFSKRFEAKKVDPCVRNILQHIYRVKRWRLVAAQVPIWSDRLQVATAIDLLCTDAATRTELHLIELKASRHAYDDSHCYQRARGFSTKRGLKQRLPLSFHTQHQVQLWAMQSTLADEIGVRPTSALVLRAIGPGVQEFPLWSAVVRNAGAVAERLRVRVRRK